MLLRFAVGVWVLMVLALGTGRTLYAADDSIEVVISVISPDGKIRAETAGKGIHLIDAATQRTIAKMEGHNDKVTGLAISPDGKSLVSIGKDKKLCKWDFATGKQLLAISLSEELKSVSFSQDGKQIIATDANQKPRIWDAATGKEVK